MVWWRFSKLRYAEPGIQRLYMSLLSLIAVFLIEQLQPLNYRRVVAEPLAAWADFIESRFNAGAYRQGVIAWCLGVLVPVMLVGLLYGLLYSISPLLGLLPYATLAAVVVTLVCGMGPDCGAVIAEQAMPGELSADAERVDAWRAMFATVGGSA